MSNKNEVAELELGYNVEVKGRHVLVTDAMKNYAVEKLHKLDRLGPRAIDVVVTMDIQKLEQRVDIVMRFNHWKIAVHGVSEDMYKSIDKAVDRLQSKLRRYKSRIQEHSAKSLAVVEMDVQVMSREEDELAEVNDEIESANQKELIESFRPHKIVASETRPMKVLTMHEAAMKLELSEDFFMVFRSEEDQKVKVIYRRSDGNFGIIQPE